MVIFRSFAAALPQILILLLLGGSFDLLGGWNHTDAAFGVLILLFAVAPLMTAILLIVEIVRYRRLASGGSGSRSFLMPGVAIFLFVESLTINIFILSQAKMH